MANEVLFQYFGLNSMMNFAFNHKSGWIARAWEDDTRMRLHFEAKFKDLCMVEGYASPSVVMRFIKDLDKGNRKIMFDYILDNY